MSRTKRPFTDEEVTALSRNPYTYKVTSTRIQFTAEFKEDFWQKHLQGESCNQILEELGYDPKVLGKYRVYAIKKHIEEQVNSPEGIHTGYRQYRRRSGDITEIEDLPPDKAFARMQNEIIYLRQELEFIKKIIKSDSDTDQRQ